MIIVICSLVKKMFKTVTKVSTFLLNFVLEAYPSVDTNVIDKSDILNNHRYLMIKNNIKQCCNI